MRCGGAATWARTLLGGRGGDRCGRAAPTRDQDPGCDERAARQLDRIERFGEQDDGDRRGEERLEVRGERRARRPDPVERAEPELVRQDERARRRKEQK